MCDIDLGPPTLKINRCHPLLIRRLTFLAGTVQSVSCLQALWTDRRTDRHSRHTIIRPDKSCVGVLKYKSLIPKQFCRDQIQWLLDMDKYMCINLIKVIIVLTGMWGEVNLLFNVTINNILVIYMYVTAHRCAGRLKKFDLRSDSQRHRHFVGFSTVPVQAPTRGQPFYTVIPRNRPI